MRKVVLSLVVLGLFVGGTFSNAQAQMSRPAFSLNFGAQTNLFKDSSFDNLWFTLDARLGIPIGRYLEISPEVMAMVDDSLDFDAIWLYPGAILNIDLGNYFVGAGAVLPIVFFEGESDTGKLSPKANVGFRSGNLMLTAYIIISIEEGVDFFELNWIGATIGFRF